MLPFIQIDSSTIVDLKSPQFSGLSPKEVQLKATCQEFESIFLYFLLTAMRRAELTPDETLFGPRSTAEKIFTDMLDERYAEKIAQAGGVGLGEMLFKQLRESAAFQGETEKEKAPMSSAPGKVIDNAGVVLLAYLFDVGDIETPVKSLNVRFDLPILSQADDPMDQTSASTLRMNELEMGIKSDEVQVDPQMIDQILAFLQGGAEQEEIKSDLSDLPGRIKVLVIHKPSDSQQPVKIQEVNMEGDGLSVDPQLVERLLVSSREVEQEGEIKSDLSDLPGRIKVLVIHKLSDSQQPVRIQEVSMEGDGLSVDPQLVERLLVSSREVEQEGEIKSNLSDLPGRIKVLVIHKLSDSPQPVKIRETGVKGNGLQADRQMADQISVSSQGTGRGGEVRSDPNDPSDRVKMLTVQTSQPLRYREISRETAGDMRHDISYTPIAKSDVAATSYRLTNESKSFILDAGAVTHAGMNTHTVLRADQNLVDQIVHRVILSASEGRSEMQLHLEPPDLGRLFIRLVYQDNILTAHIRAQNEAVASMLRANLSQLHTALMDKGINVADLSVSVGYGWMGSNQQSDRERTLIQHEARPQIRQVSPSPVEGNMVSNLPRVIDYFV